MKAYEVDLKNAKTAEEALDIAKLNWAAEPMEMVTSSGIVVPDHKAIVRSDNNKVIGVVGNRYNIIQNSSAFSFFDALCTKNVAHYHKAYIMDDGAKIILKAHLNGSMFIRKGDECLREISLVNAFDGTYTLMAIFTVMRLVCLNGLMRPCKESKAIIRHTKSSDAKIEEAFRILNMSQIYFKQFEESSKLLAQKILTKRMVEKFLDGVVGKSESTRKENIRETISGLYHAGMGTGKGTAWDLYNGYIEYIDHNRSAKEETRLANAVLGAKHFKEKAYQVAMSL
jgi:phage/plasmid-like protein (TIGR03299 family)